jgi:hypothetical protein
MTLVAAGLLGLAVLLVGPVPAALADAHWPVRAPRAGLVVWQAVGLAGGLSAVGAGIVYALAPYGPILPAAASAACRRLAAGDLRLGVDRWLALGMAVLVGARLLSTLAGSAARTRRARGRHRDLVDLVSRPAPGLPGALLLDSPAAVAYCVPGGRRGRVVLSAGAVAALDGAETAAVLAHERAHLAERHHLVLLPFEAWAAALPWFTGVRRARAAVATLVEMVADDRALPGHDPRTLAAAITRLAGGGAPSGALALAASATVQRVERLLGTVRPAPAPLRVAAYAAAILLVTGPTAILLGAFG